MWFPAQRAQNVATPLFDFWLIRCMLPTCSRQDHQIMYTHMRAILSFCVDVQVLHLQYQACAMRRRKPWTLLCDLFVDRVWRLGLRCTRQHGSDVLGYVPSPSKVSVPHRDGAGSGCYRVPAHNCAIGFDRRRYCSTVQAAAARAARRSPRWTRRRSRKWRGAPRQQHGRRWTPPGAPTPRHP